MPAPLGKAARGRTLEFDSRHPMWHARGASSQEVRMPFESHLAELQRRHEALKREIEDAQRQPGFDELEIVAMKRRKLRIKDEIAKLMQHESTLH
jgi:hypothetical protein